MERLGPIDRALLGLETDCQMMHVLAVAVIEPDPGVPRHALFERFQQRVDDRLPLVPALGRTLAETGGINGPVWIDDEDLDITRHVLRTSLPAPGDLTALAEAVGVLASSPLERDKPLWEFWFVDGLAGGEIAIVCKVHHAVLDGVTGVASLALFFDLEAQPPVTPPLERHPEAAPSTYELAREAVGSTLEWAASLPRAVPHLVGFLGELVGMRAEDEAAVPMQAPKLAMNGSLGPTRQVSLLQVARSDLDEVRAETGGTLNDIIVTVCAGALRRYLLERDELPDRPLVAAIPVAEHEDPDHPSGNHFGTMFFALPVHLDEPLDRLEFVSRSARVAKTVHERSGRGSLAALLGLAPAALLKAPMAVVSRLGLIARIPTPINLVISNVPGSRVPLFLDGGRVSDIFPMGPLFEGCGMNLTVVSYVDRVGFGFQACRETVDDLEFLAAAVPEAVRELRKAVDRPEPGPPA
ncbi:MAG TPA: wax ester/triacylglycerol synthase family O-acyltransferase [Microthrixaceae bacterium]|nr:wax ester/triacylglycerol synthase family O-acyltransferase [Microthrixaceae bacterium]